MNIALPRLWAGSLFVALLALGSCVSPSGGGGGAVAAPCVDSTQCGGYPCTNGFCDYSSFDAGQQGETGGAADSSATDTGGAAVDTGGGAVDTGAGPQDTGGTPPDTAQPDTNQPPVDTFTPPQDAGCKTASGKPCCTSDAQCDTGSACAKGSCDLGSGECKTTPVPNCCQSNADCGAGNDPCKKGVCNTQTKACSFEPVENGDPCDDGDPCTEKDNCVVGKCSGQPKNCDDGDACTTDSCNAGVCKNDGDPLCCKSGACCDLSKSVIKAKGSQCGLSAKTESRCTTDGLAVEARYGVQVCDGSSKTCPTGDSAYGWSEWLAVKSCDPEAKCTVGTNGKAGCGVPNGSSSCTSGVCCDTSAGKIKGKGAQCSTSPYGSKLQCVGNTVFKSNGYKGCSGSSSSTCYSSSSYRFWAAPELYKICPQGQYCYTSSSTNAYCKTGTKCSSGACCDIKGTGVQLPKYTKCGTTPVKTETKCAADGKSTLKRDFFQGCSGSSATCSTSSSYYQATPWVTDKTCGANEGCTMADGKAICDKSAVPQQCTSGVCCDLATKRFKPLGTKCASTVYATQYRCASNYKTVQSRKAYKGCTGQSATTCSSSSTYRAWGEWTTYKTCSSSYKCKQSSSSSSTPYCSSSPYKCSSGSCCDSGYKYYSPRYTMCSSSTKSTRYRCSQDGKSVEKRTAHYGCVGYGSSCSTSSSYYHWTDWTKSTDCPASQHCVQSSSTYASCKTPSGP